MYGSSNNTLKECTVDAGTLKLTKSIQHRHGFLKSGRGTIKTKITYCVYIVTSESYINIHEASKQSDANKIYRIVERHGYQTYQKLLVDCAELAAEFKKSGAI